MAPKSTPASDPQPEFQKAKALSDGKATKRAKDKENAAVSAKDGKAREAIANNQKRVMRSHVQRKSRVKPLTKSSGSGRGNAQTRRRKDSRD